MEKVFRFQDYIAEIVYRMIMYSKARKKSTRNSISALSYGKANIYSTFECPKIIIRYVISWSYEQVGEENL